MLAGIAALALAAPAEARADYCEGEDAPITEATADSAGLIQLCLLNVHRTANGLAPLTLDPGLASAARSHSRWMEDNDVLCHYPDPEAEPPVPCDGSPDSRAAAAGYPFPTGENIAWTGAPGYSSRRLFGIWLNSPGHNANMLFADYATAGVGPALRYRAQRRHRDRRQPPAPRRLPRCPGRERARPLEARQGAQAPAQGRSRRRAQAREAEPAPGETGARQSPCDRGGSVPPDELRRQLAQSAGLIRKRTRRGALVFWSRSVARSSAT